VNEPNEFRAYFTLTGDFNPAEITLEIGLEPTEQYRKGDRFGRKQIERKFSRWSLESRLSRECLLEDHIADVVTQLLPVKERIAKLKEQWEANMALVAYFSDNPHGFFFNAKTITALAEMNLGMDLSLYYEGEKDSANIIQ
jgi:hypothetical protein